MFWNNVVLLSLWALMCWPFGTALFFTIYLISASLAGGVGIILFTVQHNFEHSMRAITGAGITRPARLRDPVFDFAALVKLVYR